MNAGNQPGSVTVQCSTARDVSMTLFAKFSRRPLAAMMAGAVAAALPLAAFVPATPLAAQSEASQLDRAVKALRGISTLKADFTQTDRTGKAIGGKLTLKNPGKIRFEYSKDVNMLVVSNGKALTLVDYDVQQVQRWPISNSPLGALLDPKRDVKRYGKLRKSNNPNVISIEVSDPKKPEYGEIMLIFVTNSAAPGGLELVSWVALDSQNQRTTVRLNNHRYGASVPDSAFTFRDPRRSTRRPG